MISKNEILELATLSGLLPNVVEKDYVLGWLLAGINNHQTLRDPSHINAQFLRGVFIEIAGWIYEQNGIEIPIDSMRFDIHPNPRGVDGCQGRIYYSGPLGFGSKHAMPKIKLDLTADEVLVEEPVMTPVRHDYSDYPEEGIEIQSYSYAEVFAEKIRALKERTRPRDLYDVINFFRRPESCEIAPQVKSVLAQKCDFKRITFPTLNDLDEHKVACASGWQDQLAHQLQALPPFDSFWNELPAFFAWLENPEQVAAILSAIPSGAGEVSGFIIDSGTPQLSMLERIRFAAVNRLCVEMVYRKESGQHETYLIEPYSLRTTAEGNLVMYAVKLPIAQIRAFRTDRINSATITGLAFTPRYSIDFIPEGPVRLSATQSTSRSLTSPRSSARVSRLGGGPIYVFTCSVCGKSFNRSSREPQLNPHKNKQGRPCRGRRGIFKTTKYWLPCRIQRTASRLIRSRNSLE